MNLVNMLYKYICAFSWYVSGVIYGKARNLDTRSRCVAIFMLRPLGQIFWYPSKKGVDGP